MWATMTFLDKNWKKNYIYTSQQKFLGYIMKYSAWKIRYSQKSRKSRCGQRKKTTERAPINGMVNKIMKEHIPTSVLLLHNMNKKVWLFYSPRGSFVKMCTHSSLSGRSSLNMAWNMIITDGRSKFHWCG